MTDRLDALRGILKQGSLSTQDELRRKLEKLRYAVTQSTISRDLRRIGAVRATDAEGNVVYRLPETELPSMELDVSRNMVKSIQPASAMVVIHTAPGTASLVARQLDLQRPAGFIGTIAGDDTVFVALATKQASSETLREIQASLGALS